MVPALHVPPSHSACDPGPYIKIPPLPRREAARVSSCIYLGGILGTRVFIKVRGILTRFSHCLFALAQARILRRLGCIIIRTLLMFPAARWWLIGARTKMSEGE